MESTKIGIVGSEAKVFDYADTITMWQVVKAAGPFVLFSATFVIFPLVAGAPLNIILVFGGFFLFIVCLLASFYGAQYFQMRNSRIEILSASIRSIAWNGKATDFPFYELPRAVMTEHAGNSMSTQSMKRIVKLKFPSGTLRFDSTLNGYSDLIAILEKNGLRYDTHQTFGMGHVGVYAASLLFGLVGLGIIIAAAMTIPEGGMTLNVNDELRPKSMQNVWTQMLFGTPFFLVGFFMVLAAKFDRIELDQYEIRKYNLLNKVKTRCPLNQLTKGSLTKSLLGSSGGKRIKQWSFTLKTSYGDIDFSESLSNCEVLLRLLRPYVGDAVETD